MKRNIREAPAHGECKQRKMAVHTREWLGRFADSAIHYVARIYPRYVSLIGKKFPSDEGHTLMRTVCGQIEQIFEQWLADTLEGGESWIDATGRVRWISFDWAKQCWIVQFEAGGPVAIHRRLAKGAFHPHTPFPEADHAAHLAAELDFDGARRCCDGVCGRC